MRLIFLIVVVTIFGLSFTNDNVGIKKCSSLKGKVLLMFYDEDIDLKVIKDYRNEKKRYSYLIVDRFCWEPFYNSLNKTLEVSGYFKVRDSSKIVLIECEKIMDITLPFKYLNINIDRLINDSVVSFTLLNKKHILEPGHEVFDSIVTIEKEGKRVFRRVKTIHIENYGLILKKNIIDKEEGYIRANEKLRIRDSIEQDELNKLEKKK